MAVERLQTLIRLNRQLAALGESGVWLDLGIEPPHLTKRLADISHHLSTRVTRGESLQEVIDAPETGATPEYRAVVSEWLNGADLTALLESRRLPVTGNEAPRQILRAGLLYPVSIFLLACLGLGLFCWMLLPTLEATYTQIDQPVGTTVRVLQTVREWGPVLGIVMPLLAGFGFWQVARDRTRLRRTWLPRHTLAESRRDYAARSEEAAALLEAGVDRQEALAISESGVQRKNPLSLPLRAYPLFSWGTSPESGATPGELRAVSTVYHDLADRRSNRFATLVPAVACVLIGGGATLLYGLALFAPVIDLLWKLSLPVF